MQSAYANTDVKKFKVAAVSSNANSFGLRGMVVVARDGEAWELAANSLNVKSAGESVIAKITLDDDKNRTGIQWGTYELPRQLPSAPKAVVAEIWK